MLFTSFELFVERSLGTVIHLRNDLYEAVRDIGTYDCM